MRHFERQTTHQTEADALQRLTRLRASGARLLSDDALDAATAGVTPPFPLKVQVQTTTRCNAARAMCPYPEVTGEPSFEHEQMDEALYDRLLAQLSGRGIQRFSPFLMNEPLLDKRMPELIAKARTALPHTTLNLFTNGSALTVDRAQAMYEAGLDELCVSVHGFEQGAYERVMVGLRFERVWRQLDAVIAHHRAGGLGAMTLKIVTGDVPEVTQTLPAMPSAWADYVVLKGFSNERTVSEVMADLQSSAGAQGRALGERRPLCQRPFVKLYVMADGDCVICNCDWRRRAVLGNLNAASLDAIWHGAAYRAVRRTHLRDAFSAEHVCAGCDYPWVVAEA
jgi:hypothetical protein